MLILAGWCCAAYGSSLLLVLVSWSFAALQQQAQLIRLNVYTIMQSYNTWFNYNCFKKSSRPKSSSNSEVNQLPSTTKSKTLSSKVIIISNTPSPALSCHRWGASFTEVFLFSIGSNPFLLYLDGSTQKSIESRASQDVHGAQKVKVSTHKETGELVSTHKETRKLVSTNIPADPIRQVPLLFKYFFREEKETLRTRTPKLHKI